jgi:hypothetical protein
MEGRLRTWCADDQVGGGGGWGEWHASSMHVLPIGPGNCKSSFAACQQTSWEEVDLPAFWPFERVPVSNCFGQCKAQRPVFAVCLINCTMVAGVKLLCVRVGVTFAICSKT